MAKTRTIVRYRKAKTHHRRQSMTIPVAVLAGFAPLGVAMVEGFQYNGLTGVAKRVSLGLTGYNPEDKHFYPNQMFRVAGPIVAGILVHKVAGKLGINRILANAGIPLLRV